MLNLKSKAIFQFKLFKHCIYQHPLEEQIGRMYMYIQIRFTKGLVQ